jgi:hypothetical protein
MCLSLCELHIHTITYVMFSLFVVFTNPTISNFNTNRMAEQTYGKFGGEGDILFGREKNHANRKCHIFHCS